MSQAVTKLLGKMYNAEINAGISSFWDGGFRAVVGDEMNGAKVERTFSVGKGPNDLPSWDDLWRAVSLFFADWIIQDHEDNEETRSGDPGCIECTHGVTPDRFNTGLCAYHYSKGLRERFAMVAATHGTTPEHGTEEI